MNPWFAVPMGGGVVLFKYDNGVSLYAKC
jgi:hypothetical protein